MYRTEPNALESNDVVTTDRMTIHRTHEMTVDEEPGGGYFWVCEYCGLLAVVGAPGSNWRLQEPCKD